MRICRHALAFLLWSGLVLGPLEAQQYVVSTLAGGVPFPTPVPALKMPLEYPAAIAVDAGGNVYFSSHFSVFKMDTNGTVTRIAGNGRSGYSGDGGPALDASLDPGALVLDGAGNLFALDGSTRVRRISPGGIITTVAGNGAFCFGYPQAPPCSLGDGGPAVSASVTTSAGIAVDSAGNLYLPDSSNARVRKISTSGIITTVAGNGKRAYSGDTLPATSASLLNPTGVAVDGSGNLFIADGSWVRKVDTNGIISTVAGGGTCPPAPQNCLGDGGLATSASIQAGGLAVDSSGNIYIADTIHFRIRKVSPSGIMSTIAGAAPPNQGAAFSGDGGPAISALLGYVQGVALDGQGNMFISDTSNSRIRKVTADGTINTVLGSGEYNCCFSGDGGPAAAAQLNSPSDVKVDRSGNVYIVDNGNARVRMVSPDGTITTVAGIGNVPCTGQNCPAPGDGGPAKSALLNSPWGVAVDGSGNLLIADPGAQRVRKVTPDGIIQTVAGNGTYGHGGDNGLATNAQLRLPARVTVDGAGNVILAEDMYVRKIAPDGTITTIAGNGTYNFSGDGGQATSAGLDTFDAGGCDGPGGGIAIDGAGDLLVADTAHSRVREITPDGTISTVAGGGSLGYPANGDGGRAVDATMYPFDLAYDQSGNLLVVDESGPRVRKVSAGGTVTTVAGGVYGYAGDGGSASAAAFTELTGIAVDAAGNIYVADQYNNAVRVLRPTNYSALIDAVVDGASQRVGPVSPGKVLTIYGAGLGPAKFTSDPNAGTSVSFNGLAGQILYTSATQVGVVVPVSLSGTSAQVTVSYQEQVSNAITIPVAVSSPGLFTLNETGSGQAVARYADGTPNTAGNPAKAGDSLTFYATGQGALTADSCGRSPVAVQIGGIAATVLCPDPPSTTLLGVMVVKVQIPSGVRPGGYVPVVLQVGNATSPPDSVWISVGN